MECKQYDDIIFLELPDDKQEEYRKCFTDELGYESLIIDINFFDIYTMKRRSASYKTEYNFEDIFLKYHYKTVPVVTKDNKMVGMVRYDDVVKPLADKKSRRI